MKGVHEPLQRGAERKFIAVAELELLCDTSLRILGIGSSPILDLLRSRELGDRLLQR